MSVFRSLLFVSILVPGIIACGAGGNTAGTVDQVERAITEAVVSPLPVSAVPKPVFSPTSLPASTATHANTSTKTATRTSMRTATKTPTSSSAKPATASLPACLKRPGQIVKKSLTTDLLRSPLEYRVYLPPCYAEQSNRRYPVLYLFHGQGYTDDQWDRIGVDEKADQLIAAGTIAPLIIVMPHDVSSAQPAETNFSRVIVEQLIPAIDRTYRTKAERLYRAVGGMSHGGGWAIHFGLTYWKIFGSVGRA